MSSDQFDQNRSTTEVKTKSAGNGPLWIGLGALAIALVGNAFLLNRSNQLNERIAQLQDNTQSQIAALNTATSSLLDQRLQEINQQLGAAVKGANDNTANYFKKAQTAAQRQGDQLASKLEEQQKEVSGQIGQLKDATDSRFNEVSTDVSSVKTDVGGVKTDVTTVKADLATTNTNLEKTGADLKRAMGDMGVMSGLIATNSKDLSALRELGERNYTEFTINKKQKDKKIGDVILSLKNADPKRNRYTLEVQADDKKVEKKDKTTNEPVQLYVSGNRQPYEIVVNQVKKDEIVGYLSTPKVTIARQ